MGCTAQATSLQNVVFKMSDAPGTQHQGLFIESGKRPLIVKFTAEAPQNDALDTNSNTL